MQAIKDIQANGIAIVSISLAIFKKLRDSGRSRFQAEGRTPSEAKEKVDGIADAIRQCWDNSIPLPTELVPTVYTWQDEATEQSEVSKYLGFPEGTHAALGEGFHRAIAYSRLLEEGDSLDVFVRSFPNVTQAQLAARASNAPDLKTPESTFQIVVSIVQAMDRDPDLTLETALKLAGVTKMNKGTFSQYRSVVNKLTGPFVSVRKAALKGDLRLTDAQLILKRFDLETPAAKEAASTVEAWLQACTSDAKSFAAMVKKLEEEAKAKAEAEKKAAEAAENPDSEAGTTSETDADADADPEVTVNDETDADADAEGEGEGGKAGRPKGSAKPNGNKSPTSSSHEAGVSGKVENKEGTCLVKVSIDGERLKKGEQASTLEATVCFIEALGKLHGSKVDKGELIDDIVHALSSDVSGPARAQLIEEWNQNPTA